MEFAVSLVSMIAGILSAVYAIRQYHWTRPAGRESSPTAAPPLQEVAGPQSGTPRTRRHRNTVVTAGLAAVLLLIGIAYGGVWVVHRFSGDGSDFQVGDCVKSSGDAAAVHANCSDQDVYRISRKAQNADQCSADTPFIVIPKAEGDSYLCLENAH